MKARRVLDTNDMVDNWPCCTAHTSAVMSQRATPGRADSMIGRRGTPRMYRRAGGDQKRWPRGKRPSYMDMTWAMGRFISGLCLRRMGSTTDPAAGASVMIPATLRKRTERGAASASYADDIDVADDSTTPDDGRKPPSLDALRSAAGGTVVCEPPTVAKLRSDGDDDAAATANVSSSTELRLLLLHEEPGPSASAAPSKSPLSRVEP